MKKPLKNLPTGTNNKPKTKTGSSIPKKPKTSPTPRFHEVTIRVAAEEYNRGLPFFEELKYLPKFILDSYRERLNRCEANNKAARLKKLAGDMDILEPIIKEMFARGKLNFLKEQRGTV